MATTGSSGGISEVLKQRDVIFQEYEKVRAALKKAISKGNTAAALEIISNNSTEALKGKRDEPTALHDAIDKNNIPVALALIQKLSTVSLFSPKDNFQTTPLHMVAHKKNKEVFDALVDRLVKDAPDALNVKDRFGRTPIDYAFEKGFSHAVVKLSKHGVPLSEKQKESLASLDKNVNKSQSTHEKSVEKSIADSARRLETAREAEKKSVDGLIADFRNWLNEITPKTDQTEEAKKCFERLLKTDFKHKELGFTMVQALALTQFAIDDEKNHLPGVQKGNIQEAIVEGLYEIERGYNLDEQGKDEKNQESLNICLGGSFNKFFEKLHGRHTLVEILFVTKETAGLKARQILSDSFLKLSEEKKAEVAKEWKKSGAPPDEFIDSQCQQVRDELFREFVDTGLLEEESIHEIVDYLSYCPMLDSVEKYLNQQNESAKKQAHDEPATEQTVAAKKEIPNHIKAPMLQSYDTNLKMEEANWEVDKYGPKTPENIAARVATRFQAMAQGISKEQLVEFLLREKGVKQEASSPQKQIVPASNTQLEKIIGETKLIIAETLETYEAVISDLKKYEEALSSPQVRAKLISENPNLSEKNLLLGIQILKETVEVYEDKLDKIGLSPDLAAKVKDKQATLTAEEFKTASSAIELINFNDRDISVFAKGAAFYNTLSRNSPMLLREYGQISKLYQIPLKFPDFGGKFNKIGKKLGEIEAYKSLHERFESVSGNIKTKFDRMNSAQRILDTEYGKDLELFGILANFSHILKENSITIDKETLNRVFQDLNALQHASENYFRAMEYYVKHQEDDPLASTLFAQAYTRFQTSFKTFEERTQNDLFILKGQLANLETVAMKGTKLSEENKARKILSNNLARIKQEVASGETSYPTLTEDINLILKNHKDNYCEIKAVPEPKMMDKRPKSMIFSNPNASRQASLKEQFWNRQAIRKQNFNKIEGILSNPNDTQISISIEQTDGNFKKVSFTLTKDEIAKLNDLINKNYQLALAQAKQVDIRANDGTREIELRTEAYFQDRIINAVVLAHPNRNKALEGIVKDLEMQVKPASIIEEKSALSEGMVASQSTFGISTSSPPNEKVAEITNKSVENLKKMDIEALYKDAEVRKISSLVRSPIFQAKSRSREIKTLQKDINHAISEITQNPMNRHAQAKAIADLEEKLAVLESKTAKQNLLGESRLHKVVSDIQKEIENIKKDLKIQKFDVKTKGAAKK